MLYHGIRFDEDKVAAFCRRHAVARLSLFGSILRDDFDANSDIDILLEFAVPTPSLMELGGMQVELTEMLGRDVDLKTWGFIADAIRPFIERERMVAYAA